MFTSEHLSRSHIGNHPAKEVSETGMAFEQEPAVRIPFRYKQFTILFGVLIALIVIFTLWFSQSTPPASINGLSLSNIETSSARNAFQKILIEVVFK